jgi:phosphohistidine swiveling domain-containing protein
MRMPEPGSGPILVPDDFPLSWEPPEEAELLWSWDQAHRPKPLTPLTGALDAPALSGGFTRAAHALSLPLNAFRTAILNQYWYMSAEFLSSPQETAARLMQLQGGIMEKSARALDDWNDLYLPEVLRLNERLREYPYAEADLRQLADFLDEVRAMRERQYEIHSLIVFPVVLAAGAFAQFYEGMIGHPENNEHYQMLGGYPNKTVEAGQALFRLVQEAPASVAETIQSIPAGELQAELGKTAAGREFRARLDAYLDVYGWRSDAFEFMDPSWREDPTPVLYILKGYLSEGTTDPGEQQAKAAAARESLVAETLEELAGDEAQVNTFRSLLRAASTYLPIQENHNFYIDQMNTVLMRLPLLELGRRLQSAAALDEVDDVFFLTDSELRDAAVSRDTRSLAPLVEERRRDWQRWSRIVPPLFVGTALPAGSPTTDVLARFFGGGLVEGSRDPRVLTGTGASRGVASGTAKVVRQLNESDKLEPGDVLVCPMTMPAWTPLFSIASAVVADSGGVLSHCAIVAREYGIPCVVATVVGTQRIRDGQRLTVDGAKGVVRIDG